MSCGTASRVGVCAGLRPLRRSELQVPRRLRGISSGHLGTVYGALTPPLWPGLRLPCSRPCPPSQAATCHRRASAQYSGQMASVHLPLPRPCIRGWGQQDSGPPPSPGVLVAWKLCPRVPCPPPSSALLPSGLGSTLTTSCPSWCLYSSAAGTALPLQVPQPSPPAATGQTEPSHPTRWCPSQDPAPCPHNGPPSMQRTTPRPPLSPHVTPEPSPSL